jgi:hypothetical protein
MLQQHSIETQNAMNDMFMSRTHETYISYDNEEEEEEEEKSMHLQEPLVLVLSECKN